VSIAEQQRVLRIALALNAAMFVIGLAAGLVAESAGLIADSLDMLADALAYGLSLFAIGRAPQFKARVARLSGSLLLLLGVAVVFDVARRAWLGSDPESGLMMATATLSLAVNAYVIRLLTRFRRGEVHLRAAWLFTRADVVANAGVIASGLLVLITGTRYPDLVIGLLIGGWVIREAVGILRGPTASAPAAPQGSASRSSAATGTSPRP
jgi:Co/Zn/Cd efflux system component